MQDSLTGPRPAARTFDAVSADAPALPRPRGSRVAVVSAVAIGAAFLAAYYGTILKLIEHWSNNDMYSYGFLVPAISGYLIWLRRGRLRNVPVAPSFGAGLMVLAAGLSMLIIGRVSATNLVEELSLPVTIWGAALLVLGRRLTQALTFPLAYLFTMIPFWDVFTGRLHLPFQLYSAAMGVGALRLLDIPVFDQGVLIELPNVTLEVAELCSGVNNLVAILCIGVPLTHFYVRGWPKRLGIIFAAALIALVSNGVRVATVCLFAYYGIRGADGDIHGPFSLLRSLAISGVGFFVLFWLISRFENSPESEDAPLAPPDSPLVSRPPAVRGTAVALAVVMMIGAGSFERWHLVEAVPLDGGLVGFPTTIGRWEYHSGRRLADSLDSLDFDEELLRAYVAPDGTEVNLFLGYLASQAQGRELGERPFLGLGLPVSQGSRVVGKSSMRDALVSKGTVWWYVSYTYVLDGQAVADEYEAKLRTTWNALARKRSNGAIILVAARVAEGDSIEIARGRFHDFVEGALAPSLDHLGGNP